MDWHQVLASLENDEPPFLLLSLAQVRIRSRPKVTGWAAFDWCALLFNNALIVLHSLLSANCHNEQSSETEKGPTIKALRWAILQFGMFFAIIALSPRGAIGYVL